MAYSSTLAYCLEYSNHKIDLLDAFDDYLRNESMVDVMLSCEGQTIKAHKIVLSAGSTYFSNIFSAFNSPFPFPVLIIKDMPFRDLKAIVEFLYRGKVVVPGEQVPSLSKSAQTLFIKGLEQYWNKSAVVNVGNSSTNQSNSASSEPVANTSTTCSTETVVKTPKARTSGTNRDSAKHSFGMSLRQKIRQNYRQLFNSDESMQIAIANSEAGLQANRESGTDGIQIGNGSTHVSYGRSKASQMPRAIKSELNYNESEDPEQVGMPILEMAVDNEDVVDVDNEDEVDVDTESYASDVSQNDSQTNQYSGTTDVEAGEALDTDTQVYASASEQRYSSGSVGTQSEPPSPIKDPGRITPRKVRTPFMGRHRKRKGSNRRYSAHKSEGRPTTSSAPQLGPIKADPYRVELIHCTLCGRVFSRTSSLGIHMKRIHADDNKQHICQLCGKKYLWRQSLHKHMRKHRG